MSNKFLLINGSNINLSDGTTTLFGDTIGADNLSASMPVKTNSNKQLVSTKLNISDINNLQSTLNSLSGGNDKTINITDAIENASTSFKGDILPSAHNTYDLGEGGTSFRDIYTNRLLSPNGLTSLTIADNNTSTFTGTVEAKDFKTSTHTSFNTDITTLETKTQNQTASGINNTYFSGVLEANILKKVGGTNIQYLMADGSSLTQSASSGNSNFYLYKIDTSLTTTPASGFVSFNTVNQSLATIIYISHQTSDGIDVEVFFKQITTLSELYIQDQNNSSLFIQYNITSAPTLTANSKIQIPVTVSTSGTTGFANNHSILVSFFQNGLEVDTRLSNLETKTQNQTAVAGTTTITGTISGVSSLTSATSKLNITLNESANDKIAFTKNTNEVAKITGISSTTVSNLVSTYGAPSLMIGLRKLNQAYTGFCVNVTDTVITTDIGFDQNGILDFSAFSTLTGTVYVNIWYDQSGYGRNCNGFLINTVKPILTFTAGIPSINFGSGNGNYFQCTATCTELGLDNPNHSIITTMRSSTVNTNIMFLHGSSVEGRNEIHTNPASFGARVIDDLGAGFSDFGSSGSFTNAQTHVLVAGALNVGTQQSAGRGDLLPTVSTTTNQLSTPLASFNIGVRFSGLYGGSLFPFIGSINEMIIFPTSWIFDSISYTNYYNSMILYRTTGTNYYDGNGLVMNNNRIIELATPVANTDAVNKAYVDSAKSFIDLTPTTTTPTLVEGRVYYDNGAKTLVYAKNNNWYAIPSSLFVPSNFSRVNLRAWYDASNSYSLSQASGTVTIWNDISGNGYDLNTVTNNPLTGTSTINGRNVVVFDGNDNIYRAGTFIDYYRHTIVIVSTATVVQNDMYGSGGTTVGDVLFNINASGTYRAHAFRSGDSLRDSTFTLNTGMSIRIQRVSATTLEIIEDGNTKKNTFSFGGSLTANPKGIFLGWRNTSVNQGFRGSMGEVLVYDTDITNNDLNVLGNYLGAKWNINWTNLT